MKITTSFHMGDEVRPEHNRRNAEYCKSQKHIRQDGRFEVWKDISLEDAYSEIFGKALEEYNSKQKRADRKIDSYLEKIKSEKVAYEKKIKQGIKTKKNYKNPCYEVIFQVGNRDFQPPEKLSKKILKKFAQDFEKRNPNLKIIGLYYHADEKTPHCHLDFIPVARGFKQGLKIQNSLSGALKELGYKPGKDKNGKYLLETAKFWNAERLHLANVARSYGLEIENPNRPPEVYESSKIMRKARDKNLELAKREAVIKDKEQTIEMDYRILEYALKKENGTGKNRGEIMQSLKNLVANCKTLKKENQKLKSNNSIYRETIEYLKKYPEKTKSMLAPEIPSKTHQKGSRTLDDGWDR